MTRQGFDPQDKGLPAFLEFLEHMEVTDELPDPSGPKSKDKPPGKDKSNNQKNDHKGNKGPPLPLVGANDIVAGVAAFSLLGFGPVARTAVVGRGLPLLFELLVLAVLFGVLIGLHADLFVGQQRPVQVQPLFDQRVDNVELTIASHVHGIQMQIIAVQGRECNVHIHSHLLVETAI